jgi:hypothetical protein
MAKALLLVGVLLVLAGYLSSTYLPPNQLTVHRGSAKLINMPLAHPFGFTLKYVSSGDLLESKAEAYLRHSSAQPVVFVHGHAGNVKQAISLTRFLLKQGLHVDVFSVDYLEGKSALSHRLLEEESLFLNKSLRYIAELYPTQQITIIAHSMGGVVSSLALALDGAPVAKVSLLVALSTPFESHPLNLSAAMTGLYKKMHEFWVDPAHDHIFVLSLTGGVRDVTVPPATTNVMELQHKNALHLYTTQIDGLHLEADHVAMVWGKELFEKLSSFLSKALENPRANLKQVALELLTSPLVEVLTGQPVREQGDWSVVGKVKFASHLHQATAIVCKDKVDVIASDAALLKLSWVLIDSQWLTVVSEPEFWLPSSHACQVSSVPLLADLSFVKAEVMGYSFELLDHSYAVHITPGQAFANPRYPIHLTVHGEGQIRAVFAQCGSEVIVKYNEHDFILYFSEVCLTGPDIWLLGFDTEFTYSLEFKLDWPGRLVMMLRDFRVHMFASAVAWALVAHMEANVLIICAFVPLALFGSQLRKYGLLMQDHVHETPLNIGPIDCVYLLVTSLFLAKAVENLTKLLSKTLNLLRSYVHIPPLRLLWTVPVTTAVLWLVPGLTYLWGLLLVLLYKPSSPKSHMFSMSCLMINLSLPIEAFVLGKDHGAALTLNWEEWCAIAAFLATTVAMLLDKTEVNDTLRAVCAVYVVLFAQDLVYRAHLAVSVLTVCSSFTLCLRTPKPKT